MIPGVIELRQYTLHPGRRDDLITLFEREFVDSQEAVGIRLIGLFRDLDDPDRFVWLRGFPDMEARRTSLESFYGGPVWAAHRDAANATMIDSDDVLLLRPVFPQGLKEESQARVQPNSDGLFLAGIHSADSDTADTLLAALAEHGLHPLSVLVTETAKNTFPRLPVRTDGPFLVWLARAPDAGAASAIRSDLRGGQGPSGVPPRLLRLVPTDRSALGA